MTGFSFRIDRPGALAFASLAVARRHGDPSPRSWSCKRSLGVPAQFATSPSSTSCGSGRIRIMTEVPDRLSIVTLGVRNMGVLRSFYRALGWRELPIGDDSWTGFLLGGVLLALFPLRDLTAEAAPGSQGPTGWSGVTLACTVSIREEVDTAFAAALAAGATPVADATDRSWGGRSAFIADPEGNRWEITGAEPGLRSGVRHWQPIGLAAHRNRKRLLQCMGDEDHRDAPVTQTLHQAQEFLDFPFDVLIGFYKGNHEFLNAMVAQSIAKFKIGFKGADERLFDLLLTVDLQKPDAFKSEVKKYLKILKKI